MVRLMSGKAIVVERRLRDRFNFPIWSMVDVVGVSSAYDLRAFGSNGRPP